MNGKKWHYDVAHKKYCIKVNTYFAPSVYLCGKDGCTGDYCQHYVGQ